MQTQKPSRAVVNQGLGRIEDAGAQNPNPHHLYNVIRIKSGTESPGGRRLRWKNQEKGTRRAKNNQNIRTESSDGQTVTQRQGLWNLSRCFYLATHREPTCMHTSGGVPQSMGKQKGGRKNQAV
ncbi:unnamed protein product [Ectocarpus sp. 12 AP-2014]